jgi:transposase
MMPNPGFPAEFKAEAVRLVKEKGRRPRAVAESLGVAPRTVYEWVCQAERDAGERDGPTSAEVGELRSLRKEIKRLREENEILEKFVAFSRKEIERHA